ncbi:MAG: LLM class flavin-dependent oxidoreductase [Paracoccus sp. (in: a-proteobacteria)]|nr:LLM class flavin-dependent oxidoreductase [Paracoccus sp. (in: a-proteobacteria)]
MRYNILDLAPVVEGRDAAHAIARSVALARMAEGLGYHRFWLAEHHNMPGIASAATSVLIGHIAGATQRIRVGAGGIMLPNHAPLAIAEQFGTLATIYPDRIDLGLGRAPGGDYAVARALRRNLAPEYHQGEGFPNDVIELLTYLGEVNPKAPVRAVPGEGTQVPVWMLGSSLYGASLAAALGLPYAFASHFAPRELDEALALYRERFQVTRFGDTPRFMLAMNVFVADSDGEAEFLKTSLIQSFARLRAGTPGLMPPPVRDVESVVAEPFLRQARKAASIGATGSPATVRAQLADLIARYRPDEVILTGQIYDDEARLKSFRLAAEVLDDLGVRG